MTRAAGAQYSRALAARRADADSARSNALLDAAERMWQNDECQDGCN
jgi:hypothetical protein